MAVREIRDAEFDEEVASGTVLVDCFATWCGPCRMLGPVIEELSEELSNVKFYKLDVDENDVIPAKYAIFSVPTMLIFKDGKLFKTLVGYHDGDEIKKFLK